MTMREDSDYSEIDGRMHRKPRGVVLYFDTLETISQLPDETAGELIKAVYDYASKGKKPQFKNELAAAIFPIIRGQVDSSVKRYQKTVNKNIIAAHYKNYCDYEKRGGRVPLDFASWKKEDDKAIELMHNLIDKPP